MAVTTSSGNGFALYNGVKLPNIDSVWTDKVNYPYAVISYVADMGLLMLCPKAFSFNGNEIPYEGITFYVYDPEGFSGQVLVDWTIDSSLVNGSLDPSFVIWSSYDILNTSNNSIFLAASDPIPLDGYTVIEWDGDTAGLTMIDMSEEGVNLYKISAETPVLDELYGGTVVSLASGTVPIDDTTSVQMSETLYVAGNYLYIALSDNTVFGSYTFPEKGIYSPKMLDGSDYVTVLAYPASGGGSGDDGGDESTAEKHYCRVNGTVYEIKSGTARIDGTFCEVKSGTVLIDGTVYDFEL